MCAKFLSIMFSKNVPLPFPQIMVYFLENILLPIPEMSY